MATKKRRVIQHEMEEESRALVRRILPKNWVVRDYVPDYGIDLAVEVFERSPDSTSTAPAAEAAGEWFFCTSKIYKHDSHSQTQGIPQTQCGHRLFPERIPKARTTL